jgi:hypothetical protein
MDFVYVVHYEDSSEVDVYAMKHIADTAAHNHDGNAYVTEEPIIDVPLTVA